MTYFKVLTERNYKTLKLAHPVMTFLGGGRRELIHPLNHCFNFAKGGGVAHHSPPVHALHVTVQPE